MKFVDSCEVDVFAGTGGNGAVAFRREKFVPFGGPSGGDGGRGGDIVFVADEGKSTLLDLTHTRTIRAKDGEHGKGKDCYGRGAEDLVVRVPVGTQVFDRETDALMFDIDTPKSRVIVAHGGRGGRGNIHFATPFDRAPRRAEPGEPGEEKKFRLELKVMADVGLLGFPNVGKSTFIRASSNARPKVADYPFTTLTPHLGVVRIGDEASFVMADIPGLIPGAAEGAGLGHRFLKHVERTRALLHLVTLDPSEGREPLADYKILRAELAAFDPELAGRPEIVAMTKSDLPDVRETFPALKKAFAKLGKRGVDLHLVSAATGEGVRDLLVALYRIVSGQAAADDFDEEAPPSSETRRKTTSVVVKKKTAKKKPAAAPANPPTPATKKKSTGKAAEPAKKKSTAKKTAETKRKRNATGKAKAREKTKARRAKRG